MLPRAREAGAWARGWTWPSGGSRTWRARGVGLSPPGPVERAWPSRRSGWRARSSRRSRARSPASSPLASQVAGARPPGLAHLLAQRWKQAAGRGGPGVVLWAPQVPGQARADYELQTGRDTFRSFDIREPDGRGGMRPAPGRAEHFPVHLVDPPAESNRLLGLDLLSEPAIAEAIAQAGRSGLPQVLLPAGRVLAAGAPRAAAGDRAAGVPWTAAPGSHGGGAALCPRGWRACGRRAPPGLAVRLAPWAPESAAVSGLAPLGRPTARAPFYVRGQAWAVEIAARR